MNKYEVVQDTHHIYVHIDKLTLLMDLPPGLAGGLTELLYNWLGDKNDLEKYGLSRAYGKATSGYKVAIKGRVPSPSGDGTWSTEAGFVLQSGPRRPKDAQVRLDINPGCLTPHGFAHLKEVLGFLNIEWAWIQMARVSRVDVAIDVYGCRPDDYAWDMPSRYQRCCYTEHGRLLTLYIGCRRSDHVAIYDKGAESNLGPEVAWTRIEFRVLRCGPVQGLRELKSSASGLLVFDPLAAKSLYQYLKKAMKVVGQMRGKKGILELYDPIAGKKIWTDLTATTPGWWQPEVIWGKWASSVTEALPTLFDISPETAALLASYKKLSPAGG